MSFQAAAKIVTNAITTGHLNADAGKARMQQIETIRDERVRMGRRVTKARRELSLAIMTADLPGGFDPLA